MNNHHETVDDLLITLDKQADEGNTASLDAAAVIRGLIKLSDINSQALEYALQVAETLREQLDASRPPMP